MEKNRSAAVIRPIEECDRLAVKDMMRVFYASPALITHGSEEIFERNVSACLAPASPLTGYVFEIGDKIAGYAMTVKGFSTEFGKPCLWIEDVFVKSEFRGRGIGTAFFDHIAEKHADCLIRLEAEADNSRAIKFYTGLGFSPLPYLEMILYRK